jgi:hypothetical protein
MNFQHVVRRGEVELADQQPIRQLNLLFRFGTTMNRLVNKQRIDDAQKTTQRKPVGQAARQQLILGQKRLRLDQTGRFDDQHLGCGPVDKLQRRFP